MELRGERLSSIASSGFILSWGERAFKAIEVIHLSKNIEKGRKSRTYSKGTPEKGLGSGVVNRTGWKIYRT